MKKAETLKDFFGTKDKPVTNEELMDFIKFDRPGYDQLALLAAKALGQEIAA